MHIQDNAVTGSYDAEIDGHVVGMIAYRLRGERIVLTHTIVEPAHRGNGIATALVRFALDDIATRDLSLTNYCSFVADYIADHPAYRRLIDPDFPGTAPVPERAPR